MLVEWTIDWDTCHASNCTEVYHTNNPVWRNLFPKESRREDSPYSNNRPADPIFVWNVTDWNLGTNVYVSQDNFPTFRTELIIYPEYDFTRYSLEHSHASLVYYPFDRYKSKIFAFAQDTSTNESVSLVLDSATGLTDRTSFSGLKIMTDIIGEDMTYWEDFDPAKQPIDVIVTLQRSTLVIAYCLIITFTFWLVTLMICLIMIATVAFGFRQRNEIVVVPIGTVFAFTQLRSSMPGAPEGFDFSGLLPCLVLLSISAVTMVGIYLFADPDDSRRKAFTWDELDGSEEDRTMNESPFHTIPAKPGMELEYTEVLIRQGNGSGACQDSYSVEYQGMDQHGPLQINVVLRTQYESGDINMEPSPQFPTFLETLRRKSESLDRTKGEI
ncbi:hypothetical protein ARMGADRAFT_1120602 [Armillaria gallica]|uniref:Uncharacterized protein n=1 Tax=Armillaria gallica TaxID=47427 RepID=A0A2H3DL76_ARMGA|nr:hypothetical protein ARMGADRAFT_1120602 [Armillaria gallica]